MTRKPRSRRSVTAAGFTLVEVVVALTLFGLLLVFLFGGLHYGNRIAAAGTGMTDRAAAVSVAETFLRNQLSAAEPLPRSDDEERGVVSFDGEEEEVDFVTLPPVYLALGGFHWMHVLLEGTGEDRNLVVRWEPASPSGSGSQNGGSQKRGTSVLLEHVKAVHFSYFGSTEPGALPEWQDHWRDMPALPRLVRLKLTFTDGRDAPTLIVAPRLTGIVSSAR